MPITIAGSGTITGISAGGLPDDSIIAADIAAGAVTAAKLDGAQSGSAPVYGCRAWVNFDGTKDTTGATSTANTNRLILASGNVTSVLRNGTGDYTVTFTTAMPDANYSIVGMSRNNHVGATDPNTGYGASICISKSTAPTTTAVRIWAAGLVSTGAAASVVTAQDQATINVAIFR